MTVFFSPHHDDETLYGAFTLIRERPQVIVCYPSVRDYGTTAERLTETNAALAELGCEPAIQWDGSDLIGKMHEVKAHGPTHVWAPDPRTSHRDHLAVFYAAADVFPGLVRTYHTYELLEKVRSDTPVPFEAGWVPRKLRALAQYRSQSSHLRASWFFMQDLYEYRGADR